MLAPSVATNIELLLLSTGISMYCSGSHRAFEERGESKSWILVRHLTAKASSTVRLDRVPLSVQLDEIEASQCYNENKSKCFKSVRILEGDDCMMVEFANYLD